MGRWIKQDGALQYVREGRMPEGGIGVDGKANLMNRAKMLSKMRGLSHQISQAKDQDTKDKLIQQIDFLKRQISKIK